jgi:hypothetical protein
MVGGRPAIYVFDWKSKKHGHRPLAARRGAADRESVSMRTGITRSGETAHKIKRWWLNLDGTNPLI